MTSLLMPRTNDSSPSEPISLSQEQIQLLESHGVLTNNFCERSTLTTSKNRRTNQVQSTLGGVKPCYDVIHRKCNHIHKDFSHEDTEESEDEEASDDKLMGSLYRTCPLTSCFPLSAQPKPCQHRRPKSRMEKTSYADHTIALDRLNKRLIASGSKSSLGILQTPKLSTRR